MAKTYYGTKVIRQDGKSLDGKIQFVKNEWHESNGQYVAMTRDMLSSYGNAVLAYFACQEPMECNNDYGVMCFQKVMWVDDCPERLQKEDSANLNITDKQQRDRYAIFNDRSKSPKQIFVKDLTGNIERKRDIKMQENTCMVSGTKILVADGTVKGVEQIVLDDKLVNSFGDTIPVVDTKSANPPVVVRSGTVTAYVMEKLLNNPMDVTDLAQMYKTEFKDARLLSAIKANISTALNQLKKKGADVVKIKCGRYAIRGEKNADTKI